ncbi:VCBS repeat-containing protein [Algoriphagus sp. H41]|uniref:VCBS repeat-containing protein n=1 Tax=Algoriphagus oliviformis TaxID=2811231 RepID=A0ABS3C229_9BACT|nr:VCBS repeat-containing protein [Algoriphagus oliviformis]MBN7810659.1 VCBS repeat-containing protein [Algoriphagus oliviformis]
MQEQRMSLFEALSPDSTGIHFTNQIQETAQANILTYQYFYNGGGVAVGDLNNDGLEDLYFTANQGQNKLFLNQGELKFRDITLATGTGGRDQAWSTGAVIVDINADGLKDIYVCYSGDLPEELRSNQLFVNQGLDAKGIPFFKEMAKDFGLDDPAFSTSAYFSDLDKDGDLDLLLLNHNPALFNNLNVNAFKTMLATPDPMSSSKVYRNEGGKFRDVSAEIGIATGTLSYGLGASIADFNGDGWPDIYIGNDYSAPDYFYVNQGDGTFVDQVLGAFGHTSLYSMGVDAADFNRDGALDLITLDMLPEDSKRQKLLHSPENYEHYGLFVEAGLHHQLMRNMLQVNNANGTFSEVGQAAGLAMTDWSWAPLFADFDNDGWPDLFVSNGFLKDFTNLDFINYREQVLANPKPGQQQILELIAAMPATKLGNYAFKNQNGSTFRNSSADWGLDTPSNSNGAAYADLDGDGDLELIVNNLNDPSQIYKNLSRERQQGHFIQVKLAGEKGNSSGVGAKLWLYSDGATQYQEQAIYRGFQGNVSEVLHFGLENPSIDSLRIQWPNGKVQMLRSPKADQRLTLRIEEANGTTLAKPSVSPRFQLVDEFPFGRIAERSNDFKRQSQLLYSLSRDGVFFGEGDLNGDGEADLAFATSRGHLMRFDGKSQKLLAFPLVDIPPNITALLCLDLDADGDLDLYLANGGYGNLSENDPALQDLALVNDGKGTLTAAPRGFLPESLTATSVAVAWDYDGDGREEIFLGGGYTPGRWPESAGSSLLKKSQSGFEIHADPILDSLKRVKDALVFDLDGDGVKELVVASEFDRLRVISAKDGKLVDRSSEFFPAGKTGLWRSLLLEDLDGDGSPELLAGNWGLNSRLRTEEEMPVRVYFADFDQNGSVDPLMTFPIQGKEVPFLSRDELAAQMYRKKALFPKHEGFASAGMADILTPEELSRAATLDAERLETQLFTLKNGRFEPLPLPAQVQYAPVNVALALEGSTWGKELLLLGNIDQPRLKLGKMDANQGLLLRWDQVRQSWLTVPQTQSGLPPGNEVNSAVTLGNRLWVGVESEGVKVFEYK